jgi:peptidoglycan hydrolase-like protein with peptidoglycan-binding domain
MEIQRALADRGYLEATAPTGIWDAASIAALKKFQQEQNLTASGKIDSLSLIALGLGPRHEEAAKQTLPPELEP